MKGVLRLNWIRGIELFKSSRAGDEKLEELLQLKNTENWKS